MTTLKNSCDCPSASQQTGRAKILSVTAAVKVDGQWHEAGGCQGGGGDVFVSKWTCGKTAKAVVRRADGKPFKASMVRVELISPLLDYAHVVVPDCGRHYVMSRQSFTIRALLYRVSGQNAGHPFFALADEAGRFLMAFGLVNPRGEVKVHRIEPLISERKALVGGDDRLRQHFEYAGPAEAVKELEIELFVSGDEPTWFHALRNYTDAVKRREDIEYPDNPDAWRPTWCTWTAWGSHEMTEEKILANARECKDLGIGTIILDDGWFGPGLDTDEDIVLNLGEYYPDPAKFKDLAAHIKTMQAMGLKVLLWFAPLTVARTSKAYEQFKQYAMYEGGREYTSANGLALLCPACPEVRQRVGDEVERLLRDYGADGLKVDLYNCLPHDLCDRPDHKHDVNDAVAAVEATMAEVWRRAKAVRSDVLIELKQDYGNVRLAQYGTMVRAGDTAYDSDTNTMRCFYTQAFAGVVHNDYLITGNMADAPGMAQLMIRSIAGGVPTFGMDFPKFSAGLKAVIKAWMAFYNANVKLFRMPREPQNNDLSAFQAGGKDLAWVAALRYCREVTLPNAAKVMLMNGTAEGQLYLRLDANWSRREVTLVQRDHLLRKVAESTVTLADGMRLSVPPAGMVEITRA